MADAVFAVYAFAVGTASFFSPCSVGLLPAYVGYFLGARGGAPPATTLAAGRRGAGLGLAASLGALSLFVAMALLVLALPLRTLAPAIPVVALAVGILIFALGLYLLAGGTATLRLPHLPTQRTRSSIFLFGIGYALASVGCTFPLFLSVILGGTTTASASSAAVGLLAYALGMAVVMVAVTVALSIAQESTGRFLQRAAPLVQRTAPILMLAGGAYLVWFYIDAMVV